MAARVLLLITDLKIGGTPRVVRELAIRLHRSGMCDVEVACLAEWGPVANELVAAGVPVTALGARSPLDAHRTLKNFINLLCDRRFTTCFSFLAHANAMAAAASLFLREVRFIQSIQTTQLKPRWHWYAQAAAQHAAELIVVPSKSVADVARERAGIPRSKIVVIPNAVDPTEFAGLGVKCIDPGGTRTRPRHIGFIGRLDPIKRVGDLLAAVQRLAGQIHLHIFGDGADRPNIEAEIRRLAIDNLVTLHGSVVRPQEAMRQIELLVLPSDAEGLSLVLIEALAAGIPIVGTNVPGIRDVVRHGETGLLVPPRSPAALAEGISRILADQSLCEKLVAAGQRDVRERFSWESVMPQYLRVLGR